MTRLSLLGLLAACLSPTAQAQPSFEPRLDLLQACVEGEAVQAPVGMAICAYEGVEEAERRIEALLREARAPALGLRPRDLSAAQSHWRQYRDLHCGQYGRRDRLPGSQAPANIELCRFHRTLLREAELRTLIYEMGPR